MKNNLVKKLTISLICLVCFFTGIIFSYAESPTPVENNTPTAETSATPAPSATPTVEPTASPSPTPAGSASDYSDAKIEVTANGTILHISQKPEDMELPAGFVEFTYIYKDNLVWAAENKDSGIILMYLEATNKEKSGLYAYDKESEVFTKYINITASTENYIILQKPDNVPSPEGFLEKQVNIEGEEITVWVSEAYKYLSAETSEYYVVYAMNPQGEKGFYVYDRIEVTFQRFGLEGLYDWSPMIKNTAGPMDVVNPEPEENDTWMRIWDTIRAYFTRIFTGEADIGDWVVMGVLGFILVLLCIIVVFIIYARRKINEEKSEEVPLEESASKRKRYRKSQLFQSGFTGGQNQKYNQGQNTQYGRGYQQNPQYRQPAYQQGQPYPHQNMYPGQVPPVLNQWGQPQYQQPYATASKAPAPHEKAAAEETSIPEVPAEEIPDEADVSEEVIQEIPEEIPEEIPAEEPGTIEPEEDGFEPVYEETIQEQEETTDSEDDLYEYYEDTEDPLPYDNSLFSDVVPEQRSEPNFDFKVSQYNSDMNKKQKQFGDDLFK